MKVFLGFVAFGVIYNLLVWFFSGIHLANGGGM